MLKLMNVQEPIMNAYAINMWIALFATFVLWWIFQVGLYYNKVREWRPVYERLVQEELTEQTSWVMLFY